MSQAKTQATDASVAAYLDARATTPALRADGEALMAICAAVTGEPARMWGPSIVGHGAYRYRYESGRTGESCLAGFALRGKELVVYLAAEGPEQAALLARLGPYRMGKACLYIKRLADLDAAVLQALIADSVAELKRRYGADGHPPSGAGG